MPQTLPTGLLFLLASATQAQQIGTLITQPAEVLSSTATADSTQGSIGGLSPFTTLQPALSRVAGVQVTPYSGAPGAWSTVRIRGVANVTGSSQPLYVVDGVPIYNNDITPEAWSSAYAFFNGSQSSANSTPNTPTANPLLDMPVEDIEQVEIVKGAAATALYGMQGTNGVIIIRTRRTGRGAATPQPLRVRYAGWAGVQQVRQRYEVLGARQYANLANAAAAVNNFQPPFSPTELNNLQDVDWQDQVLRVAASQNHNLSVDGRAHNTSYYVAADYLQQTGVVKASGLSRYHLRVNLDQQLTPKLSLGLKASASQTTQHYAGREPDAGPLLQDVILGAPVVRTNSNPSIYDVDPLHELKYFSSKPRTRRLLAQLSATYQFNNDWRLSVRGSREQADTRALGYSPDYLFGPNPSIRVIQSTVSTTNSYNWVADAALRYQHTFGNEHAFTASLSYLRQQFERRLEHKVETPNSYSRYNTEERNYGIHSPTAQLGYTYGGRYEVQASLRSEIAFNKDYSRGSYYWFPGGQVSWHLKKEAFLADVSGLSALTLWAGAGRTSSYFYWTDRTIQQDAGLRLGMLGGKLTLDIAAYQRRTTKAQTRFPMLTPNGTGFITYITSPDISLTNKGLEFTLSSTWQRDALLGTSQLALATNRNQIEVMPTGYFFSGSTVLREGQPVSSFNVFEQQGTYPDSSPKAGQVLFRDRSNNGTLDYEDSYNGGTGLPRYTLCLNQQLHLRRFQLDAQVDGLFGYKILNTTLLNLDAPTGNTNSSERALDYWTPNNQNTSIPRPSSYPTLYRLSDQSLESGNHVRLSQLILGYEVVNTDARKVSVWIGGQNLFVTGGYRGYDPNVSSAGASPMQAGFDASVYPVARVWQLGVRAQF